MIEIVKTTEELQENLKVIKQILERIIAVGEVVEINPRTHRVRVKLKGRQNVITDYLPVLVPMSYKDKVYALPKVGDTVLCVFLPYGIEDGFVLGSFYTLNDEKPANDENIHVVEFEDGTRIEYSP
ncbi:MAG: baseplate assembly protein [Aquifex sp.]|nr:MAG: baseplate assembly protein [Aquifex sp.]